MKRLTQLLPMLFIAACATSGTRVMVVVPLKHADAHTVARQVGEEENAAWGHLLRIVADERKNSIVVEGKGDDVTRVEFRIRELDVAADPK